MTRIMTMRLVTRMMSPMTTAMLGAARARLAAALAFTALGCAPLGLVPPGTDDAPEVVNVVLYDASIDVWPRLVARGKVAFEIVDHGALAHGFRIVGRDVDETSDELLGPNEHRRLVIKLSAGSYRIFCPDGNHADLGVSAPLVVDESVSWFRR
jgi:hypothetical protein